MIRSALPAAAVFLCVLGGLRLAAECPAGTWTTLAPMSEPRQEMAVAALDGKIYAVGGLAGRANANTIYDPVRDSWSLGADFPLTTDHGWAVSVGGRLYVGAAAATASSSTIRRRTGGRRSPLRRTCMEAPLRSRSSVD